MIQISITLNDYHEVELFHDWLQILEARREMSKPELQAAVKEAGQIARSDGGRIEPDYTEVDEPTNVKTYNEITDAELEAAITTYWQKRGLPAAKDILAKYEVERVGAIPANRRGEAMLDMAV